MFTIKATRLVPANLVDAKGVAIDDGFGTQIQLASFGDKRYADYFASKVRENVSEKEWKVWVE